MPTKTKSARKPVRAQKQSPAQKTVQPKMQVVESKVQPARKTRYVLAPLILSVVGAYLLIYFGFVANLSTDMQTSLLGSAGVEPLQANLWAFVGMFLVIVALVTFLLTEKLYEKKVYFTPRKDRITLREDIWVLGSTGIIILLSVLACISYELIGLSANIAIPLVVFLAFVLMEVFLFLVRKNEFSMPFLEELSNPRNM
jgi:hypothetical protein